MQDVSRLGADAEVGVGLREGDQILLVHDKDAGKRETPAGLGGIVVVEAGVVERDVDEDGLEVTALLGGDGVGEAELLGYGAARVGEQREVEAVLVKHEDVLARSLRGDGDEERAAAADLGVQIAPGFEFGDAVRIPAATEEFDNERAQGEKIGRADGLACACVRQRESRCGGAGLEDAVFDAGGEELGDGLLGEGEALGLHEGPRVLSDAVELILEGGLERGGHELIIAAPGLSRVSVAGDGFQHRI